MKNMDAGTVKGFGDEWNTFSHSDIDIESFRDQFERYFSVLPTDCPNADTRAFDLGCGSGRWAWFVAPRVRELCCIDASDKALDVARRNLQAFDNCTFHLASVEALPMADASMDFGYSLGVLHHVPDTQAALCSCARKLKPGGIFLVYLYYAFDNRPAWFRGLWKCSDILRRGISRLPYPPRLWLSQLIALGVYWPLARLALWLEKIGVNVNNLPLSAYRHLPFYAMRTDALDRFGTRLEQRFTRQQIESMLVAAGFENIHFSEHDPFWCVCASRRNEAMEQFSNAENQLVTQGSGGAGGRENH